MGFADRNDAFDLISTLSDFQNQLKREKGISKYDVKEIEKDFTLKEGEKISISIKGVTESKLDKNSSTGGGLKKLAPPKGLSKLPPPGGFKPK